MYVCMSGGPGLSRAAFISGALRELSVALCRGFVSGWRAFSSVSLCKYMYVCLCAFSLCLLSCVCCLVLLIAVASLASSFLVRLARSGACAALRVARLSMERCISYVGQGVVRSSSKDTLSGRWDTGH
jgi:hypothetical protein